MNEFVRCNVIRDDNKEMQQNIYEVNQVISSQSVFYILTLFFLQLTYYMKQFSTRTLQEVQNRQNLSPLKSSTKNNMQCLKSYKSSNDPSPQTNNIQLLQKTLKTYQETITRQKLDIETLKHQLHNNKQYTVAIQQKYTILLELIQPSEEKINIETLVHRVALLENQLESLQKCKAQHLSANFLQLNQKVNSVLYYEVGSQYYDDNLRKAEKSVQANKLTISPNLLINISAKAQQSETVKNSTNRKQDRLRKQSTDSEIGVQVCFFQDYNTPIKKSNIEKFISLESQLKNNEVHLSRKRKNSEFQQNLSAVWQKLINEHLNQDEALGTKFKHKTESLLRKSIPYELRSTVWPMVFQNPLGITWQFYMQLLQRRQKGWVQQVVRIQIQKDLHRSFTGNGKQLQNKSKLIDQVQEVLQLFHLYRPDISYVQGMTYPAIILTTVVGKMRAFCILANQIVAIPFIKRLYTFEGQYPSIYCRTFDLLLKDVNSGAYQMLKRKHVSSQLFLIQWFYTFFSRGLNFQTTLKLWDHMAYFGELTIFKLAVTVIQLVSAYLTDATYEGAMGLIKEFSSYIDDKKLFDAFLNSKVTEDKYKKAFRKAVKSFQQ